jgi:hypothetical protein
MKAALVCVALACALALLAAGCVHHSQAEARALEQQIAELQKENQKLKEERDTLNANTGETTPSANAEDVAALRRAVEERIAQFKAGQNGQNAEQLTRHPSYIDSAVIEIVRSGDKVAVILAHGTKYGVRVGAPVCIWDTVEGIKAIGTVIEVKDDYALARIDSVEQGKEVKIGDTATMRQPMPQ